MKVLIAFVSFYLYDIRISLSKLFIFKAQYQMFTTMGKVFSASKNTYCLATSMIAKYDEDCGVHRFRRGTGAGAVCGAGGAVCGPKCVVSGRLKGPSRFTGRGDTVCVSLLVPHALAPWSSNAAASRPLPCSVGSKY